MPIRDRSSGRCTRRPPIVLPTCWTTPPDGLSTGSNAIWPPNSPPLLIEHLAVAPLQPFRERRHVPVRFHFLARPFRHGSGLIGGIEDLDHLAGKISGIVRESAKFPVTSRQALGSHRCRNHGNSGREGFQQL